MKRLRLPIDCIDISPMISMETAVFPGDIRFGRTISSSFQKGAHLELSSMWTTMHIGAHADAPSHYHPEGSSIAERNIAYYIGPCQVVSVNSLRPSLIEPEDVPRPIEAPRVLFRTRSFPDPNQFTSDFVALSPRLIDYLAERGVVLVGIDTPSIDPADSKTLDAHRRVFANDLAILEQLILEHVADGVYYLIALPLKIARADASPVRAVLFPRWPPSSGDPARHPNPKA